MDLPIRTMMVLLWCAASGVASAGWYTGNPPDVSLRVTALQGGPVLALAGDEVTLLVDDGHAWREAATFPVAQLVEGVTVKLPPDALRGLALQLDPGVLLAARPDDTLELIPVGAGAWTLPRPGPGPEVVEVGALSLTVAWGP
ncbi:MAG: hypothetical protein H6739_23015 [Alphaproteobacteria bacterium]|nr:hypothetical protein [Alphaproteobacteria bacterium]